MRPRPKTLFFAKLAFSFLLLFGSQNTIAQKWSFGPQLGSTIKPTGQEISSTMDSMRVYGNNYLNGQPVFGVFANFEAASFFTVKSAINYYVNLTSYLVWNTSGQTPIGSTPLGPVPKANGVHHHTIEIPINAYLRMPLLSEEFEFGLLLGLNNLFYLKSNNAPIPISRWPAESEVINSLHNSAKRYLIVPSYGLSATFFGRVELSARYYQVKDYIKPVDYMGKTFSVESEAEYLIISLGYKFYSLKIRNHQLQKEE